MRWFIPSWNGDHRLETVKEGESCRLTVVNPTPNERLLLGRFLKKLVKKKILEKGVEVPETELLIPASIGTVAPLLVKEARPKKTTITAVRYENGRLEIVEGIDKTLVELGERIDAAEKGSAVVEAGTGGSGAGGEAKIETGVVAADVQKVEAVKEPEKEAEKPKAAATVKRHTMSCPACVPGSVAPASEVLLEFLTPDQHETWAKDRVIEVDGHLSGHRYLLSHRNGRWGNRWGRICFDTDDQGVLHFHDQSVPPEEEVLAAALILGSREPWLRNEASCFMGGFTSVFKNPFGDIKDGVEDAALTQAIGYYAKLAGQFLGLS